MNDILSEKEQIEQMREWWSENGTYVIGGVVLGVALLFGWNSWRGNIVRTQTEASSTYELLVNDVADGALEAAEAKADDLYDNYAKTAYAAQARLAMARLYMDKGRDQDAADTLRGLVEGDADPALQQIGTLRLAKILLYQNKPQEVVDLLADKSGDSAFAARFAEVLGDAYVALERYDDAADRYALALADDPQLPTVDRNLIQMKINDLPANEETAVFEEIADPAAQAEVSDDNAAPGAEASPDEAAGAEPEQEEPEQ